MKTAPFSETCATAEGISLPLLRLPLACLALWVCVIVPVASARGAPEQRAFGPIQPRLSPDGQQIALSWQGAICRMSASGGTLTVLTRGEGFDIEPAWSPDGTTIAFINSANFFGGQLQWINAEDGSARKLPASVRAQGKLHFHPASARRARRTASRGSTWRAVRSRRSKGFRRTGRRRRCRSRFRTTANGCSTRCTGTCLTSRVATTAPARISGNFRRAAARRSSSRAGSRAFINWPGTRREPVATPSPTSARRTVISGTSRSPTRSATRRRSRPARRTRTGLLSRPTAVSSCTPRTLKARLRSC
ncbi:MAG: hypothetical protein DME19_16025 [Verrucomicrobia bacterium]|nr:MAG: hypothetical protein DME19_16025 [Verrucomicrobiota bacterium]